MFDACQQYRDFYDHNIIDAHGSQLVKKGKNIPNKIFYFHSKVDKTN